MITKSFWWDDHLYVIDEQQAAVTRITEDGTGLYCSREESESVTAGLDEAEGGVEVGRRAS